MQTTDFLPQSRVLSCKIWLKMSTVHLDTMGMIQDFQSMEGGSITKSRQECRHRNLVLIILQAGKISQHKYIVRNVYLCL